MSLTRMPNGEYVNIAPGTSPEVLARIRAQYAAPAATTSTTTRQSSTPETPRPAGTGQSDARRQHNMLMGMTSPANMLWQASAHIPGVRNVRQAADSFRHEATYHLDDVADSAVVAAQRAGRGENFRSAFREERGQLRTERNRRIEDAPVSSAIGGVAGMVAAPGGVAGRGANAAGRAALAGRNLTPVGRAAQGALNATRGPIGGAAAEGALQAGLTTLADTGDLSHAGQSALFGGVFGAGAGAVIGRAIPGGIRAITNRNADQAERVAYDKIASVLNRSRDDAGTAFTPASATAEIADAARGGTPMVLGDLSPELARTRARYAGQTSLPSAGDTAIAAEQRLATAADRFEDRVRGAITSRTGGDAIAATGRITDARRAAASADYAAGGAMDTPLAPTPYLMNAISKPTPNMRRALQDARTAVANDPDLPTFMTRVRQNGRMVEVPTMRAFDEIKKAFDDIIASGVTHLPDGSTITSNASRVASKQLRAFKDNIAKTNSGYAEILARQRDAFERVESIAAGKSFIDRIQKTPRELLTELTARSARNADEVRTGIIDALLSLRNTGRSPVKILRAWERHPQQRAVLEHIMGGKRKFNEFSKFVRREIQAIEADEMVLRASKNPAIDDAVENADGSLVGKIGGKVVRGQVYGGPMGAMSALGGSINDVRRGMGPEAQEATLRLLDGAGEGLESGIARADAVREARRLADLRRARAAGRITGGGVAALAGNVE